MVHRIIITKITGVPYAAYKIIIFIILLLGVATQCGKALKLIKLIKTN